MRWRIAFSLTVALLGLPLAAQGAFATGNLDCAIDDKQVNFELFALTGGAGGIVQVNQGSIAIKVGDGKGLRSVLQSGEEKQFKGEVRLNRSSLCDA